MSKAIKAGQSSSQVKPISKTLDNSKTMAPKKNIFEAKGY